MVWRPKNHTWNRPLQRLIMALKSNGNQNNAPPEDIDPDIANLSSDKKLNALLKSVIVNVKLYANDQIRHINQLAQIGLELSAQRDINRLLELIVDEARALTHADGGTLYRLNPEGTHLRFDISQTASQDIRIGGTSGAKMSRPPVPLYRDDGEPNRAHVSAHVALTGETINIPDVYEAEGFDFTGTREYDEDSGYESKSMLVIPMKNHEDETIGVLQLLNAQDPESGEVVTFSPEYVDLIASLASQAAIALTNRQLIEDLTELLNSFIRSIAAAIDEKSPYTGGHIDRVVELTMMIAEKINETHTAPFGDVSLNEEEMEELTMAAWMHDVGKITTPEYVVDKSTKLQTIFDRIELVETRFGLIAQAIENTFQKRRIELLEMGKMDEAARKQLDDQLESKLSALREDEDFIKACNKSGEFMADDRVDRVRDIAGNTYLHHGEAKPYLTDDEVANLCIRKGSLTDEERGAINKHAKITADILGQLPFPKRLANVPVYAASHHEKLDGSGYPRGLGKDALPLQARILAIADVFEALTAADRPYKEPMNLSQAVKIMGFMKEDNHIDPDIYDLFVSNQLHIDYARKQMKPEQIDIPEAKDDNN